jgi:hypothetical protein
MSTSTNSFAFGHDPDTQIKFEEHGQPCTFTIRSGDGRQVLTLTLSEAQIGEMQTLIYIRDRERDNHNPECECGDCQQRAELGDIAF